MGLAAKGASYVRSQSTTRALHTHRAGPRRRRCVLPHVPAALAKFRVWTDEVVVFSVNFAGIGGGESLTNRARRMDTTLMWFMLLIRTVEV